MEIVFSERRGREEKGRAAEERREEGGEGNSEEKDNLWWGPWKGELGRSVEARPSGGDGPCLSLTGSDRCEGLVTCAPEPWAQA